MVDFERHILAIVVSDIHIGNEDSRLEEFTVFLKDILLKKANNNLPFLRTLIILGDLFDLNATSFEDLCTNNHYYDIYETLDEIKNNNVEIILVLGNHEISTSWFYNFQFSGRKKIFVKRFKENSFKYNFLTKENLCQYLILINYENNICLGLINSIHEEPFKWIHLANRSFLNEACYFMTHGYQFEDKNIHHLITGWWDFGKNLSEEWKRFITSSWRKVKNALGKRNYSRFYENIATSHENEDSPFSHIIFGHTHKCEIKDVRKMNTGCWLKDSDPSFLAIYINGDCNLFELI
ncbi:MAG: metallophosphoesterase [Candidatus Hodarchaeota archaeon]